jgi:hypothetical protein
MGFLKRFLKTNQRDTHRHRGRSSFEDLTEDQIEAHLGVARYGRFQLTDAVRPSYDLQVVPRAGYRHDHYHDEETGARIPVLMAAASSECLLDLFLDLADYVGDEVDVVLETSHDESEGGHEDLLREHIDLPVLKSTLWDYEEMLLNDGCTGIAILNPERPVEVQFDEHKLLVVYGQNLGIFEKVFEQYGVPCDEDVRFITEAEHVHSSTDEYRERFEQLRYRLGVDE